MSGELRPGEILEALRNVNPAHFGYGQPSDVTRELQTEGFVDVVVHEDGITWHAELTQRGKQRVAQSGS